MDIRKVQLTGGSSYVISLPKTWVKSLNIKKNDPLGLIVQPDGTLLITNRISGEQTQKEKVLNIEKISGPTSLFRYLIGSYIAGYTIIRVVSKHGLPPFARKGVRRFTQMTIGQEVVEETSKNIILKDLLNPAEMPFDNTLRRMHVLVNGMHSDAIKALEVRDRTLAEDVVARDNDVDRLHWLIARQHNIVSRNASMAEKMGLTTGMVANYYLFSRIVERIGDHAVIIAQNVPPLIKRKLSANTVKAITESNSIAVEIFNKSFEAFITRDITGCNENIGRVRDLVTKCEAVEEMALRQKGLVALSMGYVIESIRRAGEYSADMSEYVINFLISEENVPSL